MIYDKEEYDEYFKKYKVEPEIISDGDEFDNNYGADFVLLTDRHIKAIQEGKALCIDINGGEYCCLLKKEESMTREEAIKILNKADVLNWTGRQLEAYCMAIKALEQTSDTGRWIWELEDWNRNKWTCSECGFSKRTNIHVKLGYKFCPNCGAKMAESEDEDLKECQKCGFNSEYGYCECPDSDKWYACPIESKKPENIKALKEDADEFSESEET